MNFNEKKKKTAEAITNIIRSWNCLWENSIFYDFKPYNILETYQLGMFHRNVSFMIRKEIEYMGIAALSNTIRNQVKCIKIRNYPEISYPVDGPWFWETKNMPPKAYFLNSVVKQTDKYAWLRSSGLEIMLYMR